MFIERLIPKTANEINIVNLGNDTRKITISTNDNSLLEGLK